MDQLLTVTFMVIFLNLHLTEETVGIGAGQYSQMEVHHIIAKHTFITIYLLTIVIMEELLLG